MRNTACRLENYFIRVTDSTIKLSYVRSVPLDGMMPGIRDSEKQKETSNIRRAKTQFLDIGQSNQWDYMGTLTSGTTGLSYAKDIRGISEWIHNYNRHNDCHIQYLMVFELGEKGKRLHAHVLLRDVPESFLRPYTPQEYRNLPADVKRLYSEYKTETGTRLCNCPSWRFGWSTLIPTDGSPKVVSYMTKYMTKGNIEFTTAFGGHAFFSSHGLKRAQKKRIPSEAAATAWKRIPSGSWYHDCKVDGMIVSSCYILDRDKISPDLWKYYSSLFEELQD